ncbi:Ig-like domain-containing protein [Myxococcus stipitatus]|uniref:Ig-like domain-containing protein n=1 Tax=Myxococcus stipitatus TaxID=83455 RepID=UPI0030CB0862
MPSLGFFPLMWVLGAAAPAPSTAPAATELPFSPQAVIQQVQLSYRPEGKGFSGEHRTYRVTHAEGQLTVSPLAYQVDPAEPFRAGLSLGAAEVRRGTRLVRLEPAKAQVARDGSLQVARGAMAEHFHNRVEGVEQSWHFPRMPTGRGALTVRVPVRGLEFQSSTASGLHFSDAKTGAGLRYGLGTWIDAKGQRTEVIPSFQDGAIVLSIPEETLKASVFPAVLDPVLSPEFGIDQPVVSVEPKDQHTPRVATDGTNFLVTWWDNRQVYTQLWAARVNSLGMLLEPGGKPIPTIPDCGDYALSYGAGYYVLACPRGLMRISSDGMPEAPKRFAFNIRHVYYRQPGLAFNGTNFLLTWPGLSNNFPSSGGALYVALLSASGDVVMHPKVISQYETEAQDAAVTAVGGSFRVVWSELTSYLLSVSVDGTTGAVGPRQREVYGGAASQARFPAVASNGEDYAFVYQYGDDLGQESLSVEGYIRRADGGSSFFSLSNSGQPERPDIAWVPDSGAYGVVWNNTRSHSQVRTEVHGAWVSPAGVVSGSAQLSTSRDGHFHDDVRIAAGAAGSMVVWQRDGKAVGIDVFGRPLEGGTPVNLGASANAQTAPAVAAGPDGYFVAWEDTRSYQWEFKDIYGARLGPTGEVLDPAGVLIARLVSPTNELTPAVAWNGKDWLVAWLERGAGTNPSSLRARRVSVSGQWVDSIPLTLGPTWSRPVAASGSRGAVVAWQENGVKGVRATLVHDDGGVTVLNGLPPDSGTVEPSVVGSGSQYLVAWEESDGVRAQRYNALGVAQGSLIDVAPGRRPSVASDGTDFLVTFAREASSNSHDLFAQRVTSTGQLSASPVLLGNSRTSLPRPSATWSGTTYLAAWMGFDASSRTSIQASRIARNGLVVDATPFTLFEGRPTEEVDDEDFSGLGLASRNDGTVLAVTSRMDHAPFIQSQRARARLVDTRDVPRANAASVTTAEDTALSITLTSADPTSEATTYAISTPPPVDQGTVQLTGNVARFTPAPDYYGTTSFHFVARNSLGDSTPAKVTIQVTAVNDPPVLAVPSTLTFDEDATSTNAKYTLTGLAAGPANESGQTLTLTATSDKPSVVASVSRTTISSGKSTLTFVLAPNGNGTANVTVTLSDNGSPVLTRSQVIAVTVRPVNDAPVATGQSVLVGEGGRSFKLLGADVDGDVLQYRVLTQPAHGVLSGTAPDVTFTPEAGFTGSTSFTFDVFDGKVASAPATVQLNITSAAPVVTWTGVTEGDEGAAVSFSASATSVYGGPFTLTWTFGDGTTGAGAQTSHVFADDGDYTVSLTVADGVGLTTTQQKSYRIRNLPPVATPVSRRSVAQGQVVELSLSAQDPGGARDPLSWMLLSGPGTLSSAGRYRLETLALPVGSHEVRALVSDDEGGTAMLAFTVEVLAAQAKLQAEADASPGGGCAAAGGAVTPWLLLAGLGWARRRQERGAR